MMLRLFLCLIALVVSTTMPSLAEGTQATDANMPVADGATGAVASGANGAVADGAEPAGPAPTDAALKGELNHLAGYIGTWEINDKWTDGTAIWARNEYEIGLGGNFVFARTFAKDGDGEPYERYHTYFSHQNGAWKTHGFTFDGSFSAVDAIEVDGDLENASFTSTWGAGGQEIKQTVQLTSKDSYSWKVWARPEGSDWTLIMDGEWKRVE